MLFNRADHLFKPVHLRFDHAVDILHMLHRRFFEVDDALLGVGELLLYNSLTVENVALDLFEGLVLSSDLLPHDCVLVVHRDLTLLFGPPDNLVHRAQTFLNLFHETSFSFQALLLITFKLFNKRNQLLLHV